MKTRLPAASCAVLLTLTLTGSALAASSVEVINLYDAFGEKHEGTEKNFGFSALVRYDGKTILFDSGTSADVLEKNTRALGIDLKEVDFAVASHSHPDHIGGFDYLLRVNPKVKIYFPHDFFAGGAPLPRFSIAGKEPEVVNQLPVEQRYFGGNVTETALASDGRYYKSVEYVAKSTKIADGLHLIVTQSPYMGYFSKYPKVDIQGLPVTTEGDAKFFGLPELSLSLKTAKGEVLIVGCSHSTVEAIVKETKTFLGNNVYQLVGGYHLLPYDRKTIQGIATRLKKLGVQKVAPAHCTGHLAFKILKDTYGKHYEFFGLGSRLGKSKK